MNTEFVVNPDARRLLDRRTDFASDRSGGVRVWPHKKRVAWLGRGK